jgi:hypothetical protein
MTDSLVHVQTNRDAFMRSLLLSLILLGAVSMSGCFWLTSPYSPPTINYPTSEIQAIAWSPDGSRCVSLEGHQQDGSSGTSYSMVTYDRDGKQISSIALTDNFYPYGPTFFGPIFVDPSNASVFYSTGSSVLQLSLATGGSTTIAYSYRAVSQSASGKYLLLTNQSAQDPHSFELVDISGKRLRPVHQWAVSLAQPDPSVAWSGDSVFGYLGYRGSSSLSLFVVDTNIHAHDSLGAENDLDALYGTVLAGGGNFYLASKLGVSRLSSTSSGSWIVQDTAAISAISADGRVIAYSTSEYNSSTLKLLNPVSGKTSTIASQASKVCLSSTADRVAYIEGYDYTHQSVRIVPVQIP